LFHSFFCAYWHIDHAPNFVRIRENCRKSNDLNKKFDGAHTDTQTSDTPVT